MCISSDAKGGIWIGTGSALSTSLGGVLHRQTNGTWQEVFTLSNSRLPGNYVTSLLLDDDKEGIWIGTINVSGVNGGGGLAHWYNEKWEIFNTISYPDLVYNAITSLASDKKGGLWIGTRAEPYNAGFPTGGNISHLVRRENFWEITKNSNFPETEVSSLLVDDNGSLWVGTWRNGLIYCTVDGTLTSFGAKLLDKMVYQILGGNNGDLWIGTGRGLAHLTFGKISSLLKDITDPNIIKTILSDKHAAILIAAKGKADTIWNTTKAVTSYIYEMLYNKGFLNSQIYYLSPEEEVDFNKDNYPDEVVDAPHPGRPLKVIDVEEAFQWAIRRGKLDQPLYFFFVDHGDSDSKLKLSQEEDLDVTKLKELLDTYQITTGNEIIIVIDACYSGILLKGLTDPRFKRAIISSTGDGLAYPFEGESFSYYLAEKLGGTNFFEAYNEARKKLLTLIKNFNHRYDTEKTQVPQFEDGHQGEWLKQVYINGNFKIESSLLSVQGLVPSTILSVKQSLLLEAEANFDPNHKLEMADRVTRVWAVVKPPRMNLVVGINGTPIVAFDYVPLSRNRETKNLWQTNWNKGVYKGDYEVTFYAEDDKNNVVSSNTAIVTVQDGMEPPLRANVQISVEKKRYQRGEIFNATMVQQLGWGYDLYVAITLPPEGKKYILLNYTNKFLSSSITLPWAQQGRKENQPIPIIKDFKLPVDLVTGQYCLWTILSPQDEDVFATLENHLWIVGQQCFEIF